MKICGYIQVSTKEQAEKVTSLESQEKAIYHKM